MNKTGQIISLDFLISLIAVTLALGLLIQFSELKTYNEKEEILWLEIKTIAETASGLLVGNPDIICGVTGGSGAQLFNLVNCIDTTKISVSPRDKLAIPSSYGFSLTGGAVFLEEGILEEKDFYSVKRLVVTNDGSLTKNEFESNSFDSGTEPVEMILKVWKE